MLIYAVTQNFAEIPLAKTDMGPMYRKANTLTICDAICQNQAYVAPVEL